MTLLLRKYSNTVATTAFFAILGLSVLMDFSTRYWNILEVPRGPKLKAWRYEQPPRQLVTTGPRQNESVVQSNSSTFKTTPHVEAGPVPATTDRAVVIFSVMPKSGSRTLYALAKNLSISSSKDIVVTNTMNGYSYNRTKKIQAIKQFVYQSHVGLLYTHMNFRRFGNATKKPIYISIVRDPIDRLASLYYFVRYGDNIVHKNPAGRAFRDRMARKNFSKETFDECVLNGGTTCRDPGGMVRHFCGFDTACRNPKMNATAFKKAIANIDRYYTAIGVMEDYVSTLRVFEGLIPGMFEGVTGIYLDQRRELIGKMKTKNKTEVSVTARKMLRAEMKADYDIFDYISNKFKHLKETLGITSDQ